MDRFRLSFFFLPYIMTFIVQYVLFPAYVCIHRHTYACTSAYMCMHTHIYTQTFHGTFCFFSIRQPAAIISDNAILGKYTQAKYTQA